MKNGHSQEFFQKGVDNLVFVIYYMVIGKKRGGDERDGVN